MCGRENVDFTSMSISENLANLVYCFICFVVAVEVTNRNFMFPQAVRKMLMITAVVTSKGYVENHMSVTA